MKQQEKIYTVTELNREVKMCIEENPFLNNFYLKGELSNITYYKSGHFYFTLKDKNSNVKCAVFNYKGKNVPLDLKEGEAVKIFGSATLYESGGQYQVIAEMLERENKIGYLYEKLEQLKKKLAEKGYFDEKRKKRLPELPLNIGVVTSGTGAAARDIINTVHKRFENINIYIYPAKVQGDGAEEEIAGGIRVINKIDFIDVIIVGRGGGSIEDLWAFNSEKVCDEIYNSEKPVISAVGHEIDFVLSDFTADRRAATPTQAAEILIPEKNILNDKIEEKKNRLKKAFIKKIEILKMELKRREKSYIIKNYISIINEKNNILNEKEQRIVKVMSDYISKKEEQVINRENMLKNLNPMGILKRGYSVTKYKGKILKSSENIVKGDEIETIFSIGNIKSTVII